MEGLLVTADNGLVRESRHLWREVWMDLGSIRSGRINDFNGIYFIRDLRSDGTHKAFQR